MAKIKFADISDIHIGALDPVRLKHELENGFINELIEDPIDILFVSGDTFDKIISMNSDNAKLANWFVHRLLEIMDGKPIYILKGTKTHDNDMLENFRFFHKQNIFIISKVSVIEVAKNFKVLFIPEEYPVDQESYYAEYFSDTYDLIIGHGQVDKLSFACQIQESERSIPTAPVFKVSDLQKIAKLVIFGHVHVYSQLKNFFYVGSFTRTCHNEEKDKGFVKVVFDTTSKKFELTFVENQYAQLFVTQKYSELDGDTFESKILYFKELVKMNPDVKFRLQLDTNAELTELEDNMLKKLSRNENIQVKQKKVMKLTDETALNIERFNFINDDLPIVETLQRFISENNGVDLDESEIEEILYEK